MSDGWLEKEIQRRHIKYIDYSTLTDWEPIGSGGFGATFKAECSKLNRTVAAKFIFGSEQDSEEIRRLVKELKAICELRSHPNVIEFYGVTKNVKSEYILIMEYANQDTLSHLLRKEFDNLTWVDKVRIAREIAGGLEYIHGEGICHLNLHPGNVLVNDNVMIISDFGLSKSTHYSATSIGGAIPYTDPNYLNNQQYNRNFASDVYSYGVICWQISSGHTPFQDRPRDYNLTIEIIRGKREVPVDGTPIEYVDMYRTCWSANAHQRPTIGKIRDILKILNFDRKFSQTSDNSSTSTLPSEELASTFDQIQTIESVESSESGQVQVSRNISNDDDAQSPIIEELNGWEDVFNNATVMILNELKHGKSLNNICPALLTHITNNDRDANNFFRQLDTEKNRKKYSILLGFCYFGGIGTNIDTKNSFQSFELSALEGDSSGQDILGICYRKGIGVDKDSEKAFYWYTKSAEGGNSRGQYNLACCYQNGIGIEKNLKKAAYWCEESAESGNSDGQCNLGHCYQYGVGVDKDLEKATYWYKKSANGGNSSGQYNFGHCYENGIGVDKDFEKAVHWYTRSAEGVNSRGGITDQSNRVNEQLDVIAARNEAFQNRKLIIEDFTPLLVEHRTAELATEKTTSFALNVLNATATITPQIARIANVMAPFLPLIGDVARMADEIADLYKNAEHNKNLCSTLLMRVNMVQMSIKDLEQREVEREKDLKSKEFYKNFKLLANHIGKVKTFSEGVSRLKGLRKYIQAGSIEKEFQCLTSEYDSLITSLNFTLAVQSEAQREKDMQTLRSEMSKVNQYLEHIEGGITDQLNRVSEKLDVMAARNEAFQNRKLIIEDFTPILIDHYLLQDTTEPPKRGGYVRKYYNKIQNNVAVNKRSKTKDDLSEILILSSLQESKYIIKFYGVIQEDTNNYFLVTEWAQYGSLKDFYASFGLPEWKTRAQVAVDISRGLTFLHEVSILHRDIRSENILIGECYEAKLANFSLGRRFDDKRGAIEWAMYGVRYMAPEKLEEGGVKRRYNTKCEIYSFGMLLWEIAEGKKPFSELGDNLNVIRDHVLSGEFSLSTSLNMPPEWKETVRRATQHDPRIRPALSEIFTTLYKILEDMRQSPRPSPSVELSDGHDNDDLVINISSGDPELLALTGVMDIKSAVEEHKKENGNREAAFEAFQRHAEFGDARAKYWTGYYLYHKIVPSVEKMSDEERLREAAQLFKEAADAGLADAQLRYGHCLWGGQGIGRSYSDAIEYFEKSAENGNSTAEYNVGNIYYHGYSVPKDEEKGKRFLILAALHDQPKAKDMCKKYGINITAEIL